MEEREIEENKNDKNQSFSRKEMTFSRAFSSHELNEPKPLNQEKLFRRSTQSLRNGCFTLEEEEYEGTQETQAKRKKEDKKDSGNVKKGSKNFYSPNF